MNDTRPPTWIMPLVQADELVEALQQHRQSLSWTRAAIEASNRPLRSATSLRRPGRRRG